MENPNSMTHKEQFLTFIGSEEEYIALGLDEEEPVEGEINNDY
ncbi:hypothetical protein [Bacillus solitudinis]|nr:hypothetical protein [Bacillus solitudinis]